MAFKTLTYGALASAALYFAVTPSSNVRENKPEYPLPQYIEVVKSSEPTIMIPGKDSLGNPLERKVINTNNIDFSKDLEIETQRYRYVKDDDWLPSRLVGHTLSIPGKILFMDWRYGWGQDKKAARASLAFLENNENIRDITLRVNHNEAFYDMYRMFTDKRLDTNVVAAAVLGIPACLLQEIWSEFSRGNYYNPLTKTAVCYSDLESVASHELGHHIDYQNFRNKTHNDFGGLTSSVYSLAGALPPVTLYKEFQASKHANNLMSPEDKWQTLRYLTVAFGTYLLASYYISKKRLQKRANGENRLWSLVDSDSKDSDKIEVTPAQILRHAATLNAQLYAGASTFVGLQSLDVPNAIGYVAAGAAAYVSGPIIDSFMQYIVQYEHEKATAQNKLGSLMGHFDEIKQRPMKNVTPIPPRTISRRRTPRPGLE